MTGKIATLVLLCFPLLGCDESPPNYASKYKAGMHGAMYSSQQENCVFYFIPGYYNSGALAVKLVGCDEENKPPTNTGKEEARLKEDKGEESPRSN